MGHALKLEDISLYTGKIIFVLYIGKLLTYFSH